MIGKKGSVEDRVTLDLVSMIKLRDSRFDGGHEVCDEQGFGDFGPTFGFRDAERLRDLETELGRFGDDEDEHPRPARRNWNWPRSRRGRGDSKIKGSSKSKSSAR